MQHESSLNAEPAAVAAAAPVPAAAPAEVSPAATRTPGAKSGHGKPGHAERRATALIALGEVFRARGYAAASLPELTEATGLGKGSLYLLFPGGKEEMLRAVLDDIQAWHEDKIFGPLEAQKPSIDAMFDEVYAYFNSGQRLCLVGRLGLENVDPELRIPLHLYFGRWQESLAGALVRNGCTVPDAAGLAEDVILSIQGALMVAAAQDEPAVFGRTVDRLRARVAAAERATK